MKKKAQRVRRTAERGVALLIAIFVLLLVSVVAIALLVSSGTETALGANYRSSSTVYYAALAGLEEARGRLLPKNANYFGSSVVPTPFPYGQPLYVINALPSETVAPWDPSNPYYDKEYYTEFGQQASAASYQPPQYSVWNNNAQNIPGPVYKWARITAATEESLGLDINSDHTLDTSTLIYYCPSLVNSQGNAAPGLILPSSTTCPSTAVQALQITALAYLPNGSQKYLQYVVAPTGPQSLAFPAALTMDGPNVGNNPYDSSFEMPWAGTFWIRGSDNYFYSSGTACLAGSNPSASPVWAVGYSNNDSSYGTIKTGIYNGTGNNNGNFLGLTPAPPAPSTPSLGYVGSSPPASGPMLSSNLQTISQVNSLVSNITQQADVTLSGGLTQSDGNNLMPSAMSANNPMTVVVNGDFTESGWTGTGYGILIVTGIFTYDPNSSWNGVILVVGKGVFKVPNSGGSGFPGLINGAVLVANTVDAAGNPLSSLGSPTFDFPGPGSQGIVYSSCWVQAAQTAGKYQILSFKEIPVP
jgi:hypothetical protein